MGPAAAIRPASAAGAATGPCRARRFGIWKPSKYRAHGLRQHTEDGAILRTTVTVPGLHTSRNSTMQQRISAICLSRSQPSCVLSPPGNVCPPAAHPPAAACYGPAPPPSPTLRSPSWAAAAAPGRPAAGVAPTRPHPKTRRPPGPSSALAGTRLLPLLPREIGGATTGQLPSQVHLPLPCEVVVLTQRPRRQHLQPPDHCACGMMAMPGMRAPVAPGPACTRPPASDPAGPTAPGGHPPPPPPTPPRSLLAPARTLRPGPAPPPAPVQARIRPAATPHGCSPWDAIHTPRPREAYHQLLSSRAGPACAAAAAARFAPAAGGSAGRAVPLANRLPLQ